MSDASAADERLPWDHPRWAVRRDTEWAAGCRWLQSWWRDHELDLPAGEMERGQSRPLIASMLPVGADRGSNFLSVQALAAADARLAEGDHSGIIQTDRLFRNLLSSQPACFNAFGPFVSSPNGLLNWVRTIDEAADEVVRIRFEWAPDRREHFGGGSAFDAVVDYRVGTGLRLLGVECKYAEDLSANDASVRRVYKTYTAESEHWRPGAESRLEQSHLWQFWLHALLAQSITDREAGYETATAVVMACAADRSAFDATQAVRAELVDPDTWLQWSPYEQLLDTVADVDGWRDLFQRRYLEFTPVEALLSEDDPRRSR